MPMSRLRRRNWIAAVTNPAVYCSLGVNPGDECSPWPQQQCYPTITPVNEATPIPSFFISLSFTTLQGQVLHLSAHRKALSTLPVDEDFQRYYYQGGGEGGRNIGDKRGKDNTSGNRGWIQGGKVQYEPVLISWTSITDVLSKLLTSQWYTQGVLWHQCLDELATVKALSTCHVWMFVQVLTLERRCFPYTFDLMLGMGAFGPIRSHQVLFFLLF